MSKWKKRSVWAVVLTSVCIVLWLIATVSSPDAGFDSEPITALDDEWTAEYKGKKEQVHFPADVNVNAGEMVRFSTKLEEQDVFINTIMVKVLHNYVRVYLNDTLLGEFGYDNKTPFGNAPYAGYLFVRLPDDWQGKTLTIEQSGYYDNYAGTLNTVYGGTKNALVYKVFRQCAPSLLINFSIIILSMFLLISSFFYRWKVIMNQLRAISIFAMITGGWLILESGGYQLFLEKAPLVSNTIFILFALLPVAAIRFIQTYRSFKESRFMDGLFFLSVVNFGVVQILQFTKTADYIETITGVHIIIILIFCGIVGKFIRTRRHKEKLEDRQLYAACIVFSLFGFVDIVRFYIGNPLANSVIFTQIGLFLFVIVLMFSAITNIVIDRENSMKKDVMQHLAFTDLLTNLPNRNAFEERMESYRTGGNQQHPMIILADLNELKHINDIWGHRKGDEAIIATGHILRKIFPDSAEVYRIGGDEFCIISDSIDEIAAEECIAKCRKSLQELSENQGMIIAASFGMCRENGQGADNAFIIADKDMYKNKWINRKQYRDSL